MARRPTRPSLPEVALYGPVKALLGSQGYSVKGEVVGCDVVAVRGDEPPVVVELKRQFGLGLVLQGIDRLTLTDAVYLAVGAGRPGRPPSEGSAGASASASSSSPTNGRSWCSIRFRTARARAESAPPACSRSTAAAWAIPPRGARSGAPS